MIPEVILSDRGGTARAAVASAGCSGRTGAGAVVGAIAGGMSTNEAGAILTLVDNRSTVQLAAAEGYSKNVDFAGMGGHLRRRGRVAARVPTPARRRARSSSRRSPTHTTRWCGHLRNYKAQTVRGGLGTGGRLGVQGGSTDASREVDSKPRQ